MDHSTLEVVSHDLRNNNFADGKALASMLELCWDNPEAQRLLVGTHNSGEVVFRSKWDNTLRPGAHFSPRALEALAKTVPYLEDAYWRYASRFDRQQVFAPLLEGPNTLARLTSGLFVPFPIQNMLVKEAIVSMAEKHGAWVGIIDVENFYANITNRHIREILGAYGVPEEVREVLCQANDINWCGSPQGYSAADLSARLILTLFDEWATINGIPYVRYVDDIYVFAQSKDEANALLDSVEKKVQDLDFKCSPLKRAVEPPERIHWVANGVVWRMPLDEHLLSPDALPPELFEGRYSDPHYIPGSITGYDHYRWLQFEEIYSDRFAPGRVAPSDTANRFVLRTLAKANSDLLLQNVAQHAAERPSNVKYMLRFDDPQLRELVCDKAFANLRSDLSLEDDRLHIVRSATGDKQLEVCRRTMSRVPKVRGVRQSLLGLDCADEGVIEMVIRNGEHRRMWPDEQANMALSMIKRKEERSNRTTRLLLAEGAMFGLMFELAEELARSN